MNKYKKSTTGRRIEIVSYMLSFYFPMEREFYCSTHNGFNKSINIAFDKILKKLGETSKENK